MTCKHYRKDGKCNLPKEDYCDQRNDYGFCTSNGIVDRDAPGIGDNMEENKIIDKVIDQMNLDKSDLQGKIDNIEEQQRELDVDRSRVGGQIYEIERIIKDIENLRDKDEPPVVASKIVRTM